MTERRYWSGVRGQGEGIAWIRAHVDHQGDACLIWPFCRVRGYPIVSNERKILKAHRVMCELVNGSAPTPEHEAAHSCGNGDGGCIHPRHLSWKTREQNQADRRHHGTAGKNMPGRRYKFTAEIAAEIRARIGTATKTDLAAEYGVTRSTIRQIELGKIWAPGTKAPRFFTDQEIEAIRSSDKTQEQLAAEYGVGRGIIGRVQRGESFCRASSIST